MQNQIGRWIDQVERHRKAALQADPVGGRRDIAQQSIGDRIATDAAGDARDLGTMQVPRLGIQPDPGGVTRLEAADIALLVVGDDASGMGIDDANHGYIGLRGIADTNGESGNGAAGR